ncbi:hypothetical protein HCN44_009872 [Aphidius gifuensis]|uniref:Peptidase M12B domain-containing protein n=1 Tax=Aphidius gifuensis TaxID=684658 RepID=A0A835CND4_APHGI|nr:hypothetical protein HCN44_009872 [Aphidius gifuensis]
MMLFPSLLAFLFLILVANISDAVPVNTTTSVSELTPVIEVLCVVDYSTYRLHSEGKNPTKVEESMKYYYSAFWKTVDIYFQQLNIKIVLKDVIIARNKFEDNHYLKVNKNRIGTNGLSFDLLNTFGKHLYYNKSLHNHDIAVYITQFDICQDVKANNSCEVKKDVITFKNEICKIKHDISMSHSVAMITDKKNIFTGIRNAVFAIGNLLGISKDGEYGAKKCKSEHGYFMSGNIDFASPYKFQWSKCSINSIKKTLKSLSSSDTLSCLFKKSKKKEINLSKAPLPGQLIPIDDYCEQITSYKSRIYTSYQCTELACRYGDDDESIIKGPAIEGSWCWDQKVNKIITLSQHYY